MKNIVINHWIKIIMKYKNISDKQLEIIKYGLEGIYLTISKTIIIFLIAIILKCAFETLIFTITYGLIRTFANGIHAKKSWMCWISSILIFILIPLIAKYYIINVYIKAILGIIGTALIFKNSPADTYKKPIINKKRRRKLKNISTILAFIYLILSITLNNQFICNCFMYSILLQNILISPLTYKLFKLPYNNYISYLEKHPDINNL